MGMLEDKLGLRNIDPYTVSDELFFSFLEDAIIAVALADTTELGTNFTSVHHIHKDHLNGVYLARSAAKKPPYKVGQQIMIRSESHGSKTKLSYRRVHRVWYEDGKWFCEFKGAAKKGQRPELHPVQ